MKRVLAVLGLAMGVLLVAGAIGWRWLRGPDPAAILASIEVPPSPPLPPAEAETHFRVAEGYRVELVASEPQVVDPVAMDWDDEGRLFVVEMRGYMGDIDGAGEDRPVGRVVVLEDTNGDGRMDRSRTFLDGLVLPRAIAVLPEGVLIGAPPELFLCQDVNADLRCTPDERRVLTDYAAEGGNVEHQENGLLPALDGWLYNAKSSRRFRLRGDRFEEEETLFRGQWGIAQDDEGRLYYNHNSGFAYVDAFPAQALLRQPATATALSRPGVNVPLAEDESVWGVRVAPGLNRAYLPGTLRADGRQKGPTGVSGLVVQRGHQFGDDAIGDVFVPESAGAAVSRFRVEWDGLEPRASHRLYDDPDWDKREFLASTDERFRPVDVKVGPDGALWVIDMDRGVIQHAHYVSDHLRAYVAEHDLAPPGETGRIWRIVRTDRPIDYRPPPLETNEARLRALDHPNGWVRDRAQRGLVAAKRLEPSILAALRRLDRFTPKGRWHALEVLAQRAALDPATLADGLRFEDAATRRAALRATAALLSSRPEGAGAVRGLLLAAMDDPDPGVRLQALYGVGALPASLRPVEALVGIAAAGDAHARQAVLASLAGLEGTALERALSVPEAGADLVEGLSLAAFMAGQRGDAPAEEVATFLGLVADRARTDPEQAAILLTGAARAGERPGSTRVVLAARPPIFDADPDGDLGQALPLLRSVVTWPGDERPGGARALTSAEAARRDRGDALFRETCATCHGLDGRGNVGLAPPLAQSSWVRDADDWLVRIALHGVRGPIDVLGERWDLAMPGHAHDPRFDDASLAGLLTHLRRSWGHAEAPVAPETVARIRAATAGRTTPWTADELRALDVDHRLDRFAGRYAVPVVGIEFLVARTGGRLEIGRTTGPRETLDEIGGGLFIGGELRIRFEVPDAGPAPSARAWYGDQSFPVSRVDD